MSPLLVIVGPTASGKTSLAIELAQKYDGEIICADSRTVYRRLDIGTAKPTREEQRLVPHHLLDVVSPDESFTVADFKQQAETAIKEISHRGKLPIMVGGSGLYVDSVLFDYSFSDGSLRDTVNPRHADAESEHTRGGLRDNTLIIGLEVDNDTLKRRIDERIDQMVERGLINEVKQLLENYPSSKALHSTGYKAFAGYISGEIGLGEAKHEFARNDYQLSRRQRTWFRRNKSIHWISDPSKADDLVTTFLNKKQ